MKPITKVLRVELVKPVDSDWKVVGPILRELQRVTAQALNYCIRDKYLTYAAIYEKAERTGEKASFVGVKQSYTRELGEKIGHCCSSPMYDQLSFIASQRFNQDRNSIFFKGDKSLPSYRNDCPLYIRASGVSIRETKPDNGFVDRYIALKMLPKEGNRIPITEFVIHNKALLDSQLAIWDRLISSQYKLGMVQLLYHKRKRKWLANISFTFEPEVIDGLNESTRVGVDLGLAVPVYMALNSGFARASLKEEGETIQSFRAQIESRRRRLRRNERGILERRAGHGRRHKIGAIEKLRELEGNFRRTANHRLSRGVINFALKHHAANIIMEDLSGFTDEKAEDRFLKTWTYYELQTMIEQKAAEAGIKVEKVNPEYTSQRCSKCGHIHKDNRNGRDFCCVECGYKTHADFNAARNLATLDIENLIKSSLKSKESETNKGKL